MLKVFQIATLRVQYFTMFPGFHEFVAILLNVVQIGAVDACRGTQILAVRLVLCGPQVVSPVFPKHAPLSSACTAALDLSHICVATPPLLMVSQLSRMEFSLLKEAAQHHPASRSNTQ
jgi:hypothetical protein